MAKRIKDRAPHSADTTAVAGVKGFAGIPKCVMQSLAYRHLLPLERAILFEIVARMDGRNNGEITISYAELAHCLNRKNQAVIGPAIARLIQHGLLDIGAESVWRERKAREYRLTFVNTTDSIGRTIRATNDYLSWKPEAEIDATDAVAAKPKSATPFVAAKIAAATASVASITQNCEISDALAATDAVIPIYKPCVGTGNQDDLEPETASDPIAAFDEDRLRREALALVKQRGRGSQVKLAVAAGINEGKLSTFLHQRMSLPAPSLARLGRALNRA